jgi:hypothetical protein
MSSFNLPYKRLDPVFSSKVAEVVGDTNAGAEKTAEPMCESQQRSEPIWNPEVSVRLAMDQIDAIYSTLVAQRPPKTRNRDSYRLIDWLTAIGLLITSIAMVAFALDRTFF